MAPIALLLSDDGALGPMILDVMRFQRRLRRRRHAPKLEQPLERENSVQHDSEFSSQSKQNAPRREDMARVLVVDDDPMVCMAIEVYLERRNFQVAIADGGEAGLRALENDAFDLMIVEIFMPRMRGFESIRIFHERAPNIPLIAMSGYAFANINAPAPDFLRMALELGASRCLRKPFTPLALLTVINECLSEARERYPNKVQLR
jgi:CheY-like chemotaxis protein